MMADGYRKLAKHAAKAAGSAFRESRLENGETQKQLASAVGKNGNSHISRLEKRAGSFGEVVATNHSTGYPARSMSMVRRAHEALEAEVMAEFEDKTFEQIYTLAKVALDNGSPSRAWRPALALKLRARTPDETATAFNTIGNIFREEGEPTEALGWYASCRSLERAVKDRTKIDRARVNTIGAFRLLGDLGTAEDLFSKVKSEPLAPQQRGFLIMEGGFLAEDRGRCRSSGRYFRLAREIFNAVGNDAYAATAEVRYVRVQLLKGEAPILAQAKSKLEKLKSHADDETRGLAFAFAYEVFGNLDDLAEATRIGEHAPSTVREAVGRARQRRRGMLLRQASAAAIVVLISLLPLLAAVGTALARGLTKADT